MCLSVLSYCYIIVTVIKQINDTDDDDDDIQTN